MRNIVFHCFGGQQKDIDRKHNVSTTKFPDVDKQRTLLLGNDVFANCLTSDTMPDFEIFYLRVERSRVLMLPMEPSSALLSVKELYRRLRNAELKFSLKQLKINIRTLIELIRCTR